MKDSPQEKRKRIITVVVLLAIIFGYGFLVYSVEYSKLYDREVSCLVGNNNEVCECFARKADFEKEYRNMIVRHHLERMCVSYEILDDITEEEFKRLYETTGFDYTSISSYYLDKNKKILIQKSDGPLTLTDSELDLLIRDGMCTKDDLCYICEETEDGFAVFSSKIDMSGFDHLRFDYPDYMQFYVFNIKTGELIDSNLTEQYIEDYVDVEAVQSAITEDTVLKIVDDTFIDEVVVDGIRYASALRFITDDNGETYGVCSFFELSSTVQDALTETLMSVAILVVFAAFVFCVIRELKEAAMESSFSFSPITIGKKWICDRLLFIKYTGVIATTAVFTLFCSLAIHTISDMVHINISYEKSQQSLSASAQNYDYNSDVMYDIAYEYGVDFVNEIAYSLTYDFSIPINELLTKIAPIIGAEEISVFDKNGTIEYSTTPYIGYSLPSKEDQPRYQMWEILNNGATDIAVSSNEHKNTEIGVRRIDSVGIFLVSIPTEKLRTIIDQLSYSKLLSLHDFENTDKIYSMRNEPTALYIMKNGSYSEKKLVNNLPMTEEGDSFIAMRTVDNERYLLNNYGDEQAVTSLGYPLSVLLGDALKYLLLNAVTYICLSFLLILGYGAFLPDAGHSSDRNEEYVVKLNQESRSLTVLSLALTTVLAVLIIIIRIAVSPNSDAILAMMDKWERSVNVISLSTVLLSLGVTVGLFFLCSLINQVISSYLSPQSATVSSMIFSIIKTLLIITFVISALEQFGVNTTAITAGLGLTGLALSIGSKDIITDLVAGVFIIMEGQIRVGDYIKVGELSGVVKSLGIRTTTLLSLGKETNINNSSLKNVTNLSKNLTNQILTVTVAIGTDVEHLVKIVQESKDRINKATNNLIIGDMQFYGINKISNLGIECMFSAQCQGKHQAIIKGYGYNELLKIFEENGIQIARDTLITVQSDGARNSEPSAPSEESK